MAWILSLSSSVSHASIETIFRLFWISISTDGSTLWTRENWGTFTMSNSYPPSQWTACTFYFPDCLLTFGFMPAWVQGFSTVSITGETSIFNFWIWLSASIFSYGIFLMHFQWVASDGQSRSTNLWDLWKGYSKV